MAGKRDFGQILKLKGKWAVRWREGHRVRQRVIGGSKALAARFLAKVQSEAEERRALGHVAVEPISMESLIAQYETLFNGEKEPSTVIREAAYMRSKVAPFFGRTEVGKVTRADVERFLMLRVSQDAISGSTRNKMLNMLSTFFQKAVALNHARENPVAGIKRQQEPLLPVPFVPVDGQAAIVAATPMSVRPFIMLLLDTGLRMGEALRLEWRDVDLVRRVVVVRTSKTKVGREAPFTRRGLEALQIARELSSGQPRVPDWVFPGLVERTVTGELRLRTTARKLWGGAASAAGYPGLRIHDLRHIWAVTCVRAGITLGELRELGGWKSLHMVLRYSRHAPENTPDLARQRLQAFLAGGEADRSKGQGSPA